MQAIVIEAPGGPDVLKLGEVQSPRPGEDEILIKVAAAGVNRADLLQRQGHYPPPPGASDILGLEVAGTVAALGSGATGWQEGDPCVALLAGGGYAEYVSAPAGQVIKPPEGLELPPAGGLIEVAATVVSNFDLVGVASGDTVLVHGGAGGIGSFAIQYAKALGARVVATAGSQEKLDYCVSIGADLATSYREDWPAAVADFTGGQGANVILDVMGAAYLEQNLSALATGGRLIIIGLQGGRKGTLDLSALMAKRGGIWATSLRARPVVEKAAVCARVAETVWPLISSGQIKPPPTREFPLAEAAEAHRLLESGKNLGKIILRVS